MFSHKYLKMILQIVQAEPSALNRMIALMLFSSVIDFLGLTLVAPFVIYLVNFDNYTIMLFQYEIERQVALYILGISILIIYSAKAIVSIYLQKKIINFTNQQLYKIRNTLMNKVVGGDYIKINKQNTNEIIYDIQSLSAIFSGKILSVGLRLASDLIICFAILAALAYQNLLIFALLAVLSISFVLAYSKLLSPRVSFYGRKYNDASDELLKSLSESVRGYKELVVLNKHQLFTDRFNKAAILCSQYLEKTGFLSSIPRYIVELIMIYFIALSCLILMVMGNDVAQTLSTMSVFAFAAIRLIPSVNAISRAILQLRFGHDTINRLYRRMASEDAQLCKSPKINSLKGELFDFQDIKVVNVSFGYGANKLVLEDLSLKVKKNQICAIIGQSGSGKSTLVNLMLGFIKPSKGDILINNKPVEDVRTLWLQKIAYLPQDTLILDTSLRHNVTLADDDVTYDNEVIAFLHKVGLKSYLQSLESGLDTRLGENGAFMSGGQKQRIAIARALFHKREILVLDEITSALDEDSEASIMDELLSLRDHCTIIIITHSKKFLNICDKVYAIQ